MWVSHSVTCCVWEVSQTGSKFTEITRCVCSVLSSQPELAPVVADQNNRGGPTAYVNDAGVQGVKCQRGPGVTTSCTIYQLRCDGPFEVGLIDKQCSAGNRQAGARLSTTFCGLNG